MEAAWQRSRMLALSFLLQKYPPLGSRLRGKWGKTHSPFSPDQSGCICPPAPRVQLFHPELAAGGIHTSRIGRIFRHGLWTRSNHFRLRFDSGNLRRKVVVDSHRLQAFPAPNRQAHPAMQPTAVGRVLCPTLKQRIRISTNQLEIGRSWE